MIPINKPQIDDDERQEILKVLDEGILTSASNSGGKRVQDFEGLLANFLHIKHAIAVNSGTAALHASILAAGIKEADEILIPSFTFVATANSSLLVVIAPPSPEVKTFDAYMLKHPI